MESENKKELVVVLDKDIKALIPDYMDNRRADIVRIQQALKSGDFPAISLLSHRMKGNGGAFGLDAISRIGATLEKAADDKDQALMKACVEELSEFLSRIKITYK